MANIKGLDVLVSVETGVPGTFTTVGGQRGATLNRSAETIDVTNKVGDGWKESVTGFKEWSMDCDGLYVVDDAAFTALETAFLAGTAVNIKISNGSDINYSGEAVITDFPIEAPYDDVATYSVSFTGTGALA